MHQPREKIMAHLESLSSGMNSQEYLRSLILARRARTGMIRPVQYHSARLGSHISFVTQASHADVGFSAERYVDEKYDSEEWVKIPSVSDKFRASAGLFWVDKSLQVPYERRKALGKNLCYLANAYKEIENRKIPIKMHFDTISERHEESDGSTTEWVLIEGNKRLSTPQAMTEAEFDSENFHKHLLHCHDNTPVQFDHTVSINRLEKKENIEKEFQGVLSGYADVHGDYNYYDCNYEEVAQLGTSYPETSFPNLYVFFSYQESENPHPALKELLSIAGRIKINNHQDMFSLPNQNPQVRATPTEKYFNSWVENYIRATKTNDVSRIARRYKNVILTVEDMKKMSEYASHKEMFPMWMHVEFTTDTMTEFAQTLKDSNLMALLQQTIVRRIQRGDLPLLNTFEADTYSYDRLSSKAQMSPEEVPIQRQRHRNLKRRVFDLDGWLNTFLGTSMTDAGSVGTGTTSSVFLGTYDVSNATSNDPKYDFYKSLMAIILKGKIKKLLKKHTRTFTEVMAGKPCYHEAVFYKITKHKGNSTSGEVVQNIYVPNTNELDIFTYIDTQVKYGQQYTYTISSYELIVGNKYSYEEVLSKVEYGKWAAVQVRNRPSLRLIETPIYVHTNRVLDNPPVSPEIQFIPYKGVANRIKLLMNTAVGRYNLPFEIIEPEEIEAVKRHRKAQNKRPDDNTLVYESDDYATRFEIFRLDYKPKSYLDFSNSRIASIHTSLGTTGKRAASTAVDDKICSNKKYYYCIRSVDIHEHVSYPSPVYEVEMVDDNGSIYPIVKTCEFAPMYESQAAIQAQRYIHISPTTAQAELNPEASGLADATSLFGENPVLGVSEESLWGKKIKIRITSRSTGRKIDFNLTYKHKHLKNIEKDEEVPKKC